MLESVAGPVVHGKGEGRTLGYPTINIAYAGTLQSVPGVYAARASVAGRAYVGAAVVGGDFVESTSPKLEMFLFSDQEIDCYGVTATIELEKYISAQEKFTDMNALVVKIEHDITAIRTYFA